jgi:uncharacterized protein (UPF0212 family)
MKVNAVNQTAKEIYLASIANQSVVDLWLELKAFGEESEEIMDKVIRLLSCLSVHLYAINYADKTWYREVTKNKEVMQELRKQLKHYFLEIWGKENKDYVICPKCGSKNTVYENFEFWQCYCDLPY